ncbi:MAG: endonuclease/exonuclease/phosphatase family protein [Rhodocyclaceae bacterium]|nr:endonuclease/exonuclease/phosphatase family protein [Rhodocyclaceae bacterium]
MDFFVLSCNILADAYIRPEYYRPEALPWLDAAWRLPALVAYLRGFEADILCLQEVETKAYSAIAQGLGKDYAGHLAAKRGRPDGCACFVRRRAFAVEAATVLHYRDGGGSATGEQDSGHLAQVLQLAGAAGRLQIANTHLKWHPPSALPLQRWGLIQIEQLLAGLAAPPTTIVCGDFNADPDSEVLASCAAAGLMDCYSDRPDAYTCNSNAVAKRIDYVQHGAALRAEPIDVPAIAGATPLPSPAHPTDHIAIGARFCFA